MKAPLISILAATFCQPLLAASVQINWSTERALFTVNAVELNAGTAANGDGALLELGYYTAATVADPFAGTWRVLATSSIGDTDVNQPGLFSTSTTLVDGTFTAPAVGTLLSIRFYDGFTVGTSTLFNAATDVAGGWAWVAPGDTAPVLNLQITKADSVFQTGYIGAFHTQIPVGVPESSTSAILAVSSLALAFRRKRLEK